MRKLKKEKQLLEQLEKDIDEVIKITNGFYDNVIECRPTKKRKK